MPQDPIPLPHFPDVPDAPGVPALARLAGAFLPPTVLLAADAALSYVGLGGFGIGAVSYGIFDQGSNPVVIGDSVVGFSFRKESLVSKYPIEAGEFRSFNKVKTPYDAKFTFTCGGSLERRAAFLATALSLSDSLALFNIVSPELTLLNGNVCHIDYQKTQRAGAQLLTVNFWCEEIRIAPPEQFSQTKETSGADQQDGGTVQPAVAPVTPSQSTSATVGTSTPYEPTAPIPTQAVGDGIYQAPPSGPDQFAPGATTAQKVPDQASKDYFAAKGFTVGPTRVTQAPSP